MEIKSSRCKICQDREREREEGRKRNKKKKIALRSLLCLPSRFMGSPRFVFRFSRVRRPCCPCRSRIVSRKDFDSTPITNRADIISRKLITGPLCARFHFARLDFSGRGAFIARHESQKSAHRQEVAIILPGRYVREDERRVITSWNFPRTESGLFRAPSCLPCGLPSVRLFLSLFPLPVSRLSRLLFPLRFSLRGETFPASFVFRHVHVGIGIHLCVKADGEPRSRRGAATESYCSGI